MSLCPSSISSQVLSPLWTLVVLSGGVALAAVTDPWPIRDQLLRQIRVCLALTAAAAVVRWSFVRWSPSYLVPRLVLGAIALAAVFTFFRGGHSQFWNAELRRPGS